MSASPIEGGYVIGGKYELVRLLGRGSMGEVWVAHHRTLGEDVAIKLMTAASAGMEVEDYATASARFRFEAQIAARLSRKTRHIVRVTDHGQDGDAPAYLVMELLEGTTLERRLMLSGDMAPADVSRLVTQIARALEFAHADNVVHRDLKPANIFLARDEDGGLLVKLLDFGIARATHTLRMTSPFSTGVGVVFGTPGYMSPEQACGTKLDARADLWALATVAYEALTGELPLVGTHVHELLRSLHAGEIVPIHSRNAQLPAGLAEFFRRAFAARIEHRFAGASELALSFDQAIATPSGWRERTAPMPVPSGLRRDTLPMAVESPPGSRGPSRRPRTAWPALALVASAVVLFTTVATRALRTPSIRSAVSVSSTAVASTSSAASIPALAPEEPPPAEPGPSASELVTPPQGALEHVHAGASRASVAHVAPLAPPPAVSAQTSRPPVPPVAEPAPPPSVTPPVGKPIDKSATF